MRTVICEGVEGGTRAAAVARPRRHVLGPLASESGAAFGDHVAFAPVWGNEVVEREDDVEENEPYVDQDAAEGGKYPGKDASETDNSLSHGGGRCCFRREIRAGPWSVSGSINAMHQRLGS